MIHYELVKSRDTQVNYLDYFTNLDYIVRYLVKGSPVCQNSEKIISDIVDVIFSLFKDELSSYTTYFLKRA
jgi:hypothetical protein